MATRLVSTRSRRSECTGAAALKRATAGSWPSRCAADGFRVAPTAWMRCRSRVTWPPAASTAARPAASVTPGWNCTIDSEPAAWAGAASAPRTAGSARTAHTLPMRLDFMNSRAFRGRYDDCSSHRPPRSQCEPSRHPYEPPPCCLCKGAAALAAPANLPNRRGGHLRRRSNFHWLAICALLDKTPLDRTAVVRGRAPASLAGGDTLSSVLVNGREFDVAGERGRCLHGASNARAGREHDHCHVRA